MELKIAGLAERAGIPVATIKYYIREGLLPRGVATAATQATYGAEHLHRLRLIRLLTEVGGLTLSRAHAVFDAMDESSTADALHALGPAGLTEPNLPLNEVDGFVGDLRWRVAPDAPARLTLARSLAELRAAGYEVDASVFRPHARAADWLVSEEAEVTGPALGDTVAAEVIFGAALMALRRMSREHHAAGRTEAP